MRFFSKLFGRKSFQNPEDDFAITITDDFIKVEHPNRKTEKIFWKDLKEIKLINTDTGPFTIDIWLALIDENSSCLIPQGTKNYEKIYNIISKYDGFNFENVIASMSSTNNEQFLLWKK